MLHTSRQSVPQSEVCSVFPCRHETISKTSVSLSFIFHFTTAQLARQSIWNVKIQTTVFIYIAALNTNSGNVKLHNKQMNKKPSQNTDRTQTEITLTRKPGMTLKKCAGSFQCTSWQTNGPLSFQLMSSIYFTHKNDIWYIRGGFKLHKLSRVCHGLR